MVRMQDVAKAAGVARVTVSRVLNETGNVGIEKREAILAAAQRLGYVRNHNAGTLACGRAMVVGAIVSDLADIRAAAIIGALSDSMLKAGYLLFLAQSHGSDFYQRHIIDLFRQRRADAIILLGSENLQICQKDPKEFYASIFEYWSLNDCPDLRANSILAQLKSNRKLCL